MEPSSPTLQVGQPSIEPDEGDRVATETDNAGDSEQPSSDGRPQSADIEDDVLDWFDEDTDAVTADGFSERELNTAAQQSSNSTRNVWGNDDGHATPGASGSGAQGEFLPPVIP